MEERLDEVEKLAKGAKSATGYESNAIDLLMKRVEKVESKWKNEAYSNRVEENNLIVTSYDLQDKLVSKVDSVTGNMLPINTNLKVIVIAEGCSSWVYTRKSLGLRCISIFCQQEEGLVEGVVYRHL